MTTTINGTITLDRDPILDGLASRQDVFAARYEAIDGTEIVTERSRASGHKLTLVMTKETGWQTQTTIEAIRALNTPGANITLVYRTVTYQCRFRNEESGGAFVIRPLSDNEDPQVATTLMIGEIRLMTVG